MGWKKTWRFITSLQADVISYSSLMSAYALARRWEDALKVAPGTAILAPWDPITEPENGFMEPKYFAFWR